MRQLTHAVFTASITTLYLVLSCPSEQFSAAKKLQMNEHIYSQKAKLWVIGLCNKNYGSFYY